MKKIPHTYPSCTLDEYLDYWKFSNNLRDNAIRDLNVLLETFPHLQNFIVKRRIEKENGKVLYRNYLTININTPPHDLFLNYLLQVKDKPITKEQRITFHDWFHGTAKSETYKDVPGWVDMETFCFALPVITDEIYNLPANSELTINDKTIPMFKLIPYYDIMSGIYKNDRYVNIKILEDWDEHYFEIFDNLNLIDRHHSFKNRIFVSDTEEFYLDLGKDFNKEPDWYKLVKSREYKKLPPPPKKYLSKKAREKLAKKK
jgi:hypothetical protein